MTIVRPFRDSDWPAVWGMLHATFAAGETHSFAPDIGEAEARKCWVDAPLATFVAEEHGFRARQFNFVVSTNERAVRLWERPGFSVVGRLPGAFRHRRPVSSMPW